MIRNIAAAYFTQFRDKKKTKTAAWNILDSNETLNEYATQLSTESLLLFMNLLHYFRVECIGAALGLTTE